MRHSSIALLVLLLAATAASCGDDDDDVPMMMMMTSDNNGGGSDFIFELPGLFPTPTVPEDNPMSEAKVELGRYLFYDTRLSGNETQSCGSCHAQDKAFTDGLPVAVGSTDEMTPRGSMSLTNVAYYPVLGWGNPDQTSLEMQALGPMFGTAPVELGLDGLEEELVERIAADPDYPDRFKASFPEDDGEITVDNIVKAISAFERTMISGDAPFDQFNRGDIDAMDSSARRGLALFFSERLECFHCHGGFNFSDSVQFDGVAFDQMPFHNNGLYNIDGQGDYPEPNQGLFDFTGDPADKGRFKAPSLRNIELTAPYMHDGSYATLEEVLDHYQAGGRNIEDGPYSGDGRQNPNKNQTFVRGIDPPLTDTEKEDVVNFLKALTDTKFLNNTELSDPW